MWVQVFDVPVGFPPSSVAQEVVRCIGRYIEEDPRNNEGAWCLFLRVRVRVSLDVEKPLRRRIKIKVPWGTMLDPLHV